MYEPRTGNSGGLSTRRAVTSIRPTLPITASRPSSTLCPSHQKVSASAPITAIARRGPGPPEGHSRKGGAASSPAFNAAFGSKPVEATVLVSLKSIYFQ